MKIIIIRDALTKTIVNTYMVNDDVTMPPGCETNLLKAGYTHTVLHPILMNQADLNAEIEDYCSADIDMGKAPPPKSEPVVDNRTGEETWEDDVWKYGKD
jgi:hypothetical protein